MKHAIPYRIDIISPPLIFAFVFRAIRANGWARGIEIVLQAHPRTRLESPRRSVA